MAEVQLEYMVPVVATVDTERGEVVKVTEHVEQIEYSGLLTQADPDTARHAYEIAEEEHWPAWDSGT